MENLYGAFQAVVPRRANAPALRMGDVSLTYGELDARVRRLARALLKSGLSPGEAVAVFTEKNPEWLVVSLALQALGLIEFPREMDLDDEELEAMSREHRFRFVFVENGEMHDRARNVFNRDRVTVVGMERDAARLDLETFMAEDGEGPDESAERELEKRIRAVRRQDISAVIRTSGTTGEPKLVRLTHGHFLYNMRALPLRLRLDEEDCVLSCLPGWHLYARIVEFTCLYAGARLVYCRIPELASALVEHRPTILPGFPEIWEQAFHGIMADMDSRGRVGRLFHGLLFFSRSYYAARDLFLGRSWSVKANFARDFVRRLLAGMSLPLLAPLHYLGEAIFYSRIRQVFGGRLRAAVIGDAPLPRFIDESLRAVGLPVLEGYGSTEQTVSAMRDVAMNVPGTAGLPLEGTSFLILDREGRRLGPGGLGRIAVHGPGVFTAYDREPHTSPEFSKGDDGLYYITGDLGMLDRRGRLRLVGREKHYFRLAAGAPVYPERVENALRGSKYIGRVLVVGENRAFTTALITPDVGELMLYLRARKLRRKPDLSLGENPKYLRRILRLSAVRRLYENEVGRLARAGDAADHEIPMAIALITEPFIPGRELTPTLKLRRRFIEGRYAKEIKKAQDPAKFAPPAWNRPAGLLARLFMGAGRRVNRNGMDES